MKIWKPQMWYSQLFKPEPRKPSDSDYSDLTLSDEGVPDISRYVGESKVVVRPSYVFNMQQRTAFSFGDQNRMDKEASGDFPINPQDEVRPSTFGKRSHSVILPSARNAGRDSFICVICLDDVVSVEDTAELGCHHRFCKSCVANQVRAQLDLNRFPITCLQENCDHDLAGELPALIPSALYQRYLDLSLKNCVGQIDGLKQCLTPDCPGLYEMEPGNNVLDCFICKRKYCLKCNSPAHQGILCTKPLMGNQVQQYLEDNQCKQCPKCKFWVEKSGGCNHMTCRCKFEFCFVCGLKWTGEHACRLFDEDEQSSDGIYDESEYNSGSPIIPIRNERYYIPSERNSESVSRKQDSPHFVPEERERVPRWLSPWLARNHQIGSTYGQAVQNPFNDMLRTSPPLSQRSPRRETSSVFVLREASENSPKPSPYKMKTEFPFSKIYIKPEYPSWINEIIPESSSDPSIVATVLFERPSPPTARRHKRRMTPELKPARKRLQPMSILSRRQSNP